MRIRPLLSIAAASLLAAAGLAGCGLGAGPTPKGATLLVTREFGSEQMLSRSSPKVHGSSTVMQLLSRNANVATKYSGGFVQSIDGHSGSDSGSAPFDWFYYINGLEAEQGASSVEVHEGDHIWWDLHNWGVTDHIPAVVGSFPEPFLDGLEGRKFPVKIGCDEPRSGPCHLVTQRLTALEVPSAFAEISPTLEAPETLALLVGTWSQLRGSPAAQLLEKGPAQSGVYARVLHGGKAIVPLDSRGEVTSSLGAGAGLIAATEYTNEGPVWIVTGTDEQGVQRAAKDFDAATLDGHFAVAISPSGRPIPLPQASG
ncbi:MAG TPA: DUF4430 domain-containing protein [Solirubrobacteraceae bacterium]|jgi:hypothetical protein